MSRPLLNSTELAARINRTERAIKALRLRKEIPYIKVGGAVRYDPDQIDRWLERHTIEPREQRG